jgi:hypothetical protein
MRLLNELVNEPANVGPVFLRALRMPVIIAPENYDRWLSPIKPDPRDLLAPYPSEPMTMWPISTRVNKPDNDDPSILEPVADKRSRLRPIFS